MKRQSKNFYAKDAIKVALIISILAIFAVAMANQEVVHVFAENDTQAPTTTSSYTSVSWQNADISITLSCADNVACNTTFYCIDDENSCAPDQEYSSQITHTDEGISYLRFYSIDTSSNIEATKSQILKIDTETPTITISRPTEGQQISGTIFVINGSSSDSLAGIREVKVTVDGNANTAVGRENWQYQWSNFLDGSHTITATAYDDAGNLANATVRVTVGNPPTARIISLGNPPLIKAGRIEVVLQTSEPVQNIPGSSPLLSYAFPGDSSIQIPLDGASQSWRGYMFITESDHNKIGTFAFSAIDFSGAQGNTITQGSFFVVDAVKPPAIASFTADVENNQARLTWFYDGEPLREYNIYRSTRNNVGYVNYYKTSPADATFTTDDLGGKTYYYKIAPVDLARNIGLLSDELVVSPRASSNNTQNQQEEQPAPQPPAPQPLPIDVLRSIDGAIENVKTQIVQIDITKAVLERNSAAQDLGLILQLNSAKATFTDYIGQLESLKSRENRNEVENEIRRINIKVKAQLNDLPREIALDGEEVFVQETSIGDVESIADHIVPFDLAKEDREKYIDQNQRLQGKFEIKTTATFFKVTLFEGRRDITLIKKEISARKDVSDIVKNSSIIEVIPKSIAASVSEIVFITQNYQILEEDPVLKFGSAEEIKYRIDKRIPREELRKAKTLVVSDNIQSGGFSNFLTGLVVYGKSAIDAAANLKIIIGLVILSLLVVFYFVYLRDGGTTLRVEGGKSYERRGQSKSSFGNRGEFNSYNKHGHYSRNQPVKGQGEGRAFSFFNSFNSGRNERRGDEGRRDWGRGDGRMDDRGGNEYGRGFNNSQPRQNFAGAQDRQQGRRRDKIILDMANRGMRFEHYNEDNANPNYAGAGYRRNDWNARKWKELGEYAVPLTISQRRQMDSFTFSKRGEEEAHFEDLIRKANAYVDDGRFSLAGKSYSLLLEIYKVLDAQSRKEYYSELLHVYNKINLYSKIKELSEAERLNPNMNLRNMLEHISEIYSQIAAREGKDTKLLRFAREYYDNAIARFSR